MKKRLKTNGIIITLTFLLTALFPAVFLRSGRITYLEEVARTFGIAFVLIGQLLRACGRGYKSENSGEGDFLIQGAPYALVRNPMYLGILLIGLGIVLMLFKWWAALIFLGVFSWRYLLLMLREEKNLTNLFPQEYKDYLKKVPRLFPSPARLLQKNVAEFFPLKSLWLKKEIGTMLAVLLPALLLQAWVDIKRGDIKAYIKTTALNLIVIVSFIFLIIYLIKQTQKDASGKSKSAL